MKNYLSTTTALAAAGTVVLASSVAMAQSAPEKIKLGLAGSFKSTIGYAEQEGAFEDAVNAHYGTINMENDSEVHFKGSTSLDNGMRVDVIVQLETDQASANTGSVIDETYLKLTGGFGDLRLGSTHAATNKLANTVPQSGMKDIDGDDYQDYVVNPTGTDMQDDNIGTSDHMKIVYFTPKFNGFQAGATYTPSTSNSDSPPITGGASSGTSADQYWFDFGLAYSNTFGDVSLDADVSTWRKGGSVDQEGYRFGAVVGMAGFTVGGTYADVENEIDGITSTTAVSDYEVYGAGVTYASGPWEVGVSYYHSKTPLQASVAGADEATHIKVAGTYDIGPGVQVGADIVSAEYEDETTAAGSNNEGWAVIAGIKVSF